MGRRDDEPLFRHERPRGRHNESGHKLNPDNPTGLGLIVILCVAIAGFFVFALVTLSR